MKDVLALVLAGGRVDELSVLTLSRPKSAVPFGGMYRVVDFCLSNLMHSCIENIGILSQYRSFSLLNHIGVGQWWDFAGRDRGATMLLPSTAHGVSRWYQGTADAVYQNLEFVREKSPETVLVLSGDHIYKMDYRPMLAFHRETGADLTIAFAPVGKRDPSRFGVARIEDGEPGGRVCDYVEKPEHSDHPWASLTIYLFRPELLYSILDENARSGASHEFGRDIIPGLIGRKRVFGYKFTGYWGYTRTVDQYWRTNMDLLRPDSGIDLDDWQVRTNLDHDRLRDRPPALVGSQAQIANSLLHNGCSVEGKVENSILFPGVKVAAGASVCDSILFFDTSVGAGAQVHRTIADFDVNIGNAARVGSPKKNADASPDEGITLIGKGARVPQVIRLGSRCVVAPGLGEADFQRKVYEPGAAIPA